MTNTTAGGMAQNIFAAWWPVEALDGQMLYSVHSFCWYTVVTVSIAGYSSFHVFVLKKTRLCRAFPYVWSQAKIRGDEAYIYIYMHIGVGAESSPDTN
jgi:hypothetical protein